MFMGGLTAVASIAAPVPAVALESWALSPDVIRAWVAVARPGAELIYARDWRLSPKSAAAEQVRRLLLEGKVSTVQRGPSGHPRAYVIQRRSAPIAKVRKAKLPKLDGDMARVLNVLRRCVRDLAPCPTNRELQKAAGVSNASYAMQKLVAAKIITSAIVDPVMGTRVVTIVETGGATAKPERRIA